MGMTKKKTDKSRRFTVIHEEGSFSTETKILQDTFTGVQYLYFANAGGGGLTPLLDRAGHPVVTPVSREEESV